MNPKNVKNDTKVKTNVANDVEKVEDVPENENVANDVEKVEDVPENEIVTGYAKVPLNLRNKASYEGKIISIIMPGIPVSINLSIPNDKFYKVSVKIDGVSMEGYCAKEFISLPGKQDGGKSEK